MSGAVEALDAIIAHGIDVFETLDMPAQLRIRFSLGVPKIVGEKRDC